MKEKRIEDAIHTVKDINNLLGFKAFVLYIYGQVWKSYEDRFNELIKQFDGEIRYCGSIDADKSVTVLKQYFALLFPTYYEGEGFAGTIIDAFSAGIPVIATDWKYNRELVHDNVGFIFNTNTGNIGEMKDILLDLYKDPNKALIKKRECLKESSQYKAESVIHLIDQLLSESMISRFNIQKEETVI